VTTVIIRKLKKEDAKDISKISEAITADQERTDFTQIVEQQTQEIENASFVAEYDGEVVGYMISYSLSGSFGIEKSAWVAMFGVDPKFMGQGIGRRLADAVFKFHKENGIKDIYTSVRWDSTDLLSFFKTLDFNRSNFINLRKKL
jgi:predicted N-acetyltransferase YhbS